MAVRVDPDLVHELERYGAQDVNKCYHCGNCSAVCPFSEGPYLFPRKSMRHLQMGLREKLRGDLEPWLCYYCGECSEQCPREAEPGETMMSMRRWLTAQYDVTGLSKLFYRSWKAELGAIVLVALLTGAGFWLYGSSAGSLDVYDGPGAFLPSATIHVFDWILAGILGGLLLINCGRMVWFAFGRDAFRVPPRAWVRNAWLLPWHFFTQDRYRRCGNRRPWAVHLVLVGSYLTMLVLIMFFLHQVQSGPAIDWRVHVFGYLASAGLVGAVSWALWGRLRRAVPQHRHSHETDWIFLGLLLYTAVTGVAQHAMHRAGLIPAANVAYVVHMMGVVPMLGLEVPFSKWAHLAYRPLAMYVAAVQAEAAAEGEIARAERAGEAA